jgi:hypothetical protein
MILNRDPNSTAAVIDSRIGGFTSSGLFGKGENTVEDTRSLRAAEHHEHRHRAEPNVKQLVR